MSDFKPSSAFNVIDARQDQLKQLGLYQYDGPKYATDGFSHFIGVASETKIAYFYTKESVAGQGLPAHFFIGVYAQEKAYEVITKLMEKGYDVVFKD
jgi:hypothetical protein